MAEPSAGFGKSFGRCELVLGHGEIGVTMNTYAHVLPQLRQEAADAMDELFGS